MTAALLGAALAFPARPAASQPLNGEMRTQFVDGGLPACAASAKQSLAGNEKFMEGAGITDQTIAAYCGCQMNALADQVTPDDYAALLKGAPPDTIKTYAKAANAQCAPLLTSRKPD